MTLLSNHSEFWPKPSSPTALLLRLVRFDAQTRINIRVAAQEFGVSAALIASVLADERVRLDAMDVMQAALVRLGLRLPGTVAAAFWQGLVRACGRSVDTFSLGCAQMKPATLRRLGTLGYLKVPDTVEAQWRLLLDDHHAPRLVAACLRATADHWAAHGVSIQHRADVLGTLYSLGFTGSRGVHIAPEASERGVAIARHADWLVAAPASVGGVALQR